MKELDAFVNDDCGISCHVTGLDRFWSGLTKEQDPIWDTKKNADGFLISCETSPTIDLLDYEEKAGQNYYRKDNKINS